MRALRWITSLGLLATLALVLWEPGRWQVYPAVFGAAITWLRLRFLPPRRWVFRLLAFPAAMAALSWGLCRVMPADLAPESPLRPPVGTRVVPLADEGLTAQVWYPAEPGWQTRLAELGLRRARYYPEAATAWSALASELRVPRVLGFYLLEIRARSAPDAPVIDGAERLPVLVFSHGLMGTRVQSTWLCEELASRGYVVVAADHPGDAAVAVAPGGRPRLSPLWHADGTGREERAELQQSWMNGRVRDLRAILGRLDDLLPGRIDPRRVGILGHSFGGVAAAMACSADPRCRAGASLSGTPLRSGPRPDPRAPFLLIEGETFFGGWLTDRRPEAHPPIAPMGKPFRRVELPGAAHGNFTDLPLLTPLHRLSFLTGDVEGLDALETTRDLLLDFFDGYLRPSPSGRPRQKAGRAPVEIPAGQ